MLSLSLSFSLPLFPYPFILMTSSVIYLQLMYALELIVDLAIVSAVLVQLRRMKRKFIHLKRTFTRLTYTLCTVTTLATLILVAEIIVNSPNKNPVSCVEMI